MRIRSVPSLRPHQPGTVRGRCNPCCVDGCASGGRLRGGGVGRRTDSRVACAPPRALGCTALERARCTSRRSTLRLEVAQAAAPAWCLGCHGQLRAPASASDSLILGVFGSVYSVALFGLGGKLPTQLSNVV